MADDAEGVSGISPIRTSDRIEAIDVLRGVALLGIFVMNLPTFAFSEYAFYDPRIAGGFEGLDRAVWWVSYLLFDMKMMTIFSMLFGAGLIVISDRADARRDAGRTVLPAAILYYRRIAVLLAIGIAHAYLLWSGDILVFYAVSGAALFPLRRLSPTGLLALGTAVLFVEIPIQVLLALAMQDDPSLAYGYMPTEGALLAERAAMLGTFPEYFGWNFPKALQMHIEVLPWWGIWRCTGLMLIGMALMRLRVLTGERSQRFYGVLALAGYALGLPLVYAGGADAVAAGFDIQRQYLVGMNTNYVGSVLVALGHIGVVMLFCRLRLIGPLRRVLAAVGRMALTNYLMQSLIAITLFCGWGFGLWGSLSRFQLVGVILAVWACQLLITPLWLRRFRFGPAEWLWRTLTYGEPQPMRN